MTGFGVLARKLLSVIGPPEGTIRIPITGVATKTVEPSGVLIHVDIGTLEAHVYTAGMIVPATKMDMLFVKKCTNSEPSCSFSFTYVYLSKSDMANKQLVTTYI